MTTHELSVWPSFLTALAERSEFSRIDQGFQVGDVLRFKAELSSGCRTAERCVTDIRPGEPADWVVLTVENPGTA